SAILIERETIDKDQFVRLLAGDPEEDVFVDPEPEAAEETPKAKERRRVPKPKPFPLPGATMQPPEPGPTSP
ncbi:MAG: ATP-dependent zinc metalloprotease FtsH, partial [Gaiellaceae bacterium]